MEKLRLLEELLVPIEFKVQNVDDAGSYKITWHKCLLLLTNSFTYQQPEPLGNATRGNLVMN